MSSTNKTAHYELPQFVENDIFNPLVDDNDAYSKIDTALYNIADAEADDAAEIVGIKGRLDTAEGKVDALETQNGTDVLTTVAQTLSGAVNELKSGEDSLDSRLDVVEDDINNISTGLKAKVTSLENQNGTETLTTVSQTLSGGINELDAKVGKTPLQTVEDTITAAVNENFFNSKFMACRYGSFKGEALGQAMVYYNGNFYCSGELGLTDKFKVAIVNDNMQITSEHLYDFDCHPNSMFVLENELYVVDSRNRNIYVINLSNMEYVRTMTDFQSLLIASGSVDGDYVYLYGNNHIYKYTKSFELIDTIELDVATHSLPEVHQGAFVFNNYIYRVWNQPNMLTIHDMTGKTVGVKNIGTGNGYYPYGEIETFFVKDGEMYFCSSIWSTSPAIADVIIEVFISNIVSPVADDSRYGQPSPTQHEYIHVSKATRNYRNPVGNSTYPFDNLYEAGCVYSYLATQYPYAIGIYCDTTDWSDSTLFIAGCKCGVRPANVKIGNIYIMNGDFNANQSTISYLNAQLSRITLNRCKIADIVLSDSIILFGGSHITTSANFSNANAIDKYEHCDAPLADISISGGFIPELSNKVDSFTTWNKIDTLAEKFTFGYNSAGTTRLEFKIFTITGFVGNDFIDIINITSSGKTSYNGGNELTVTKKHFVQDANGNNGILSYVVHIDPTNGIKIDTLTFTGFDGTSYSAPSNLYGSITWVNDTTTTV